MQINDSFIQLFEVNFILIYINIDRIFIHVLLSNDVRCLRLCWAQNRINHLMTIHG